ncbi:hypothetical protein J6590_042755 [Homalodisca vitripennis]|nr:hypothetical protein J6590_042755 [Homalodisca vitripennis]
MPLYPHGSERILPHGIQHQVCTRVSYPRVPRVPPTPSSTPCCCIRMEVRASYLKLQTRTSCTAYAFLYTMLLYQHGSESILPQGIQHQVARVSATHANLGYRLRLPPHRALEVRGSYLTVYNMRFARVSANHASLVYRLRLPPHRALEVRGSYITVYNIRFVRVSATHAFLLYRLRLPPHHAAVSAWK